MAKRKQLGIEVTGSGRFCFQDCDNDLSWDDKILIIGDFSQDLTAQLAAQVIIDYGENAEVCLAGRNIDKITDLVVSGWSPKSTVYSVGINSDWYLAYLFEARFVLLFDSQVSYVKYCRDQRVVDFSMLVSEKGEYSFAERLALSRNVTDVFISPSSGLEGMWPGVRVHTVDVENVSCAAAHITGVLDLDQLSRRESSPVVFVTGSAEPDASGLNLPAICRSLEDEGGLGLFLFYDGAAPRWAANHPLSPLVRSLNQANTVKYLRLFQGLIAYDTKYIHDKVVRLVGCETTDARLIPVDWLHSVAGFPQVTDHLLEVVDQRPHVTDVYRERLRQCYASEPAIRSTLVSVVVPTYDTPPELLLRAVRSALASTHENLEVIVVDDGSPNPVEPWLVDAIGDQRRRLRVITQTNQGQGPATNKGVRAASGEYVMFLDSDDRVISDSIELLLAHACMFDLDLVVGRRILINDREEVMTISLPYLSGDTYRVYRPGQGQYPFTDIMVHGRLIRRALIIDNDIELSNRHYQDRAMSAELYSIVSEYHFLNVNTYMWYQYLERETSSGSYTPAKLRDKFISIQEAWPYIPERARAQFLREVINVDLAGAIAGWPQYDLVLQDVLCSMLIAFLQQRREYIDLADNDLYRRAVFSYVLAGDIPSLTEFFEQSAPRAGSASERWDDYFCHTNYHILVALSLILKNQRPAQLFIYTAYQDFSAEFLATLRTFPWIRRVTGYGMGSLVDTLESHLEVASEDAWAFVPLTMNSQFAAIRGSIGPNDHAYAFNDTLPSWYIINGAFETITRLEDAYGSMDRELMIEHSYGKWRQVYEQIQAEFPPIAYSSPKIGRVIVGVMPEFVPDHLRGKVEVVDFAAEMAEQRDELLEFLSRLYSMDGISLGPRTVLLLTQPLALLGYCTPAEQFALYKTLSSEYGRHCVIKPHPADTCDYSKLGHPILSRSIPSEVLNLWMGNSTIAAVITFSSSAVRTATFARAKVQLFGDELIDHDEIHDAIVRTAGMSASASVSVSSAMGGVGPSPSAVAPREQKGIEVKRAFLSRSWRVAIDPSRWHTIPGKLRRRLKNVSRRR
ncbi:MAG: glycosyltransferase family 52 [Propionibacteriaceae bacterium]|nr:glycosyltransferase family 52 [Propionibacteriaceae bacterium]